MYINCSKSRQTVNSESFHGTVLDKWLTSDWRSCKLIITTLSAGFIKQLLHLWYTFEVGFWLWFLFNNNMYVVENCKGRHGFLERNNVLLGVRMEVKVTIPTWHFPLWSPKYLSPSFLTLPHINLLHTSPESTWAFRIGRSYTDTKDTHTDLLQLIPPRLQWCYNSFSLS